jgi:hypothetical protein
MKKLLMLFALSLILTGCDALIGKEVGRLPINQVSTEENVIIKEATLDLKKGDEIAIWSDMDIEYEGDVELRFRMEIWKNGEKMGGSEVDPMKKNITMGEIRTTINGKTEWSFFGKNSEIKIEDDGKYTIKAILVASENSSLKVVKAEMVLKK